MDTTNKKFETQKGNKPIDKNSNLHEDFHDVKDSASKAAQDIKDSASKTAEDAGEKASDMYNEVKDKFCDAQENALSYIKENPIKAIGSAMLVGFLAAILLRK